MFNGMMDPELMKMAQEQMSRMTPADFARIQQQMMSNPELMRMASESMQNLRSEDFKQAAEHLKHARPEDLAEIGDKMSSASPEEIAGMRARMDAQISYELSAAEMLKKQGNELHSQGQYNAALQKYMLAKKNLKDVPPSRGRNLLLASSLNMMSCYLKTGQFQECVAEGTEVLAYNADNVKALYRRGQAYKELGQLSEALSDLSKAHKVSPGDETVADVLRNVEERLVKEGRELPSRGLVIEEIFEEDTEPSVNHQNLTSNPVSTPPETIQSNTSQKTVNHEELQSSNTEYLDAVRNNPESIRSFQNFISRTDPDVLSSMSGGKIEGMSPDMMRTASNAIGKMSPEELQRMMELASSFQGENAFLKNASSQGLGSVPPDMFKSAADMIGKMSPEDLQKMFQMASSSNRNESAAASTSAHHTNSGLVPPNMTPDMVKMASDMMGKMSPEERQKMFDIAANLRGQDRSSSSGTSYSNGWRSDSTRDNSNLINGDVDESCFAQGAHSSSIPPPTSLNSSSDLQEQMRNQMKDPAMRQMLTSMVRNMSPEMMANMSEQFGVKLSREDAERAQQAMSSLSPDSLDTMMKWADRVQRGVEGARKTKNWLLGRPGMICALLMLLLAVILHWFGFIGQ